jgi:hypothetical protein
MREKGNKNLAGGREIFFENNADWDNFYNNHKMVD